MITAKRSVRLLSIWSALADTMRSRAPAAATSLPADARVASAVWTKKKKYPTATSSPADARVASAVWTKKKKYPTATSLPAVAHVARALRTIKKKNPTAPVAREVMTKKEEQWFELYFHLLRTRGTPEGTVTWLLDEWVNEGGYLCADQLIEYVKDLYHYSEAFVLELMEWMENTKYAAEKTDINLAMRLGLIADVRGIEAAEKYFSDLPEPAKNHHTYGALLISYGLEEIKNADKVISPDDIVKNRKITEMSCFLRLGDHEKLFGWYLELKSYDIVPDTITRCILMYCYASLNDIESVERVIKEAEEDEKIKLRWPAYCALASIYCSAGLITKAETALKKFEKLIDGQDRLPYHFLISLYSRIDNLEEVKRIWKSFKTVFPKPTNLSYVIMMRSLDKLDDINGQQDLYEEWESVCVTFDMWVANVMIGSYLRKNMIQQAQGVREKASARGAVPDLKTCDVFLDYYLKNNDMDSALMWLETAISRMKRNEWKLSQVQVDTFLKAFEVTKDVKGAERFCQCLRQLGQLDLNAYKKLFRTYLAANATDPTLRQRIEDDKIKIKLNSQTYKLLEKVCGANE